MTRQADWKRQHRRNVVLASLALSALMSAAPAFALADEQVDAELPVIDCFEYQMGNDDDVTPLPGFNEIQVVIDGGANAALNANTVEQAGATDGANANQGGSAQSGVNADQGDSSGNADVSRADTKQDSAVGDANAGQDVSGSNKTNQDDSSSSVIPGQESTLDDALNDNGANQDGASDNANAGQGGSPDGAGSKTDGQENAGGSTDGSTSDADKPGAETDASQDGTTSKGDGSQPETPEPNKSGTGTDAPQGGTTDKGDGSQTEATTPDKGDGSQTETPTPDKPSSGSSIQEPDVLTGWQNIGGYRYYYDNDGKPLTGLQTIEGKTYLFNEKGQLGYGFLHLGDGIVSYFDPITGCQTTGKQFIHGAWRNIDEQTGLNCGLTEVSESGKTNTYYYDNYDGGLHTGQQYVNNSWHFFDEDTGRMYTRDEEVRRIVQFTLAELGSSESQAFGYLDEVKADGGTYCGYGPCMATVRHIFKAAGMSGFLADGFVDSWPHKYLDLMIEKGQHTMTPRVGMVAFFLWENSFANQIGVSADHAEIIVEVGDGWYKTVGAIAGGIKESLYYTASDYNIGFGVPAFYQ